MAGKQNYVVTADLQTGKFKAGANALRREFASLKSSFVGFTSALGASFAVFNIVSRMRDVATNLSVARATLKNTSIACALNTREKEKRRSASSEKERMLVTRNL